MPSPAVSVGLFTNTISPTSRPGTAKVCSAVVIVATEAGSITTEITASFLSCAMFHFSLCVDPKNCYFVHLRSCRCNVARCRIHKLNPHRVSRRNPCLPDGKTRLIGGLVHADHHIPDFRASERKRL